MSQVQIEPVCREEWLQFAAQFRDHNYRQGWEYGTLLAQRRKATSHHVKIQRAGEIIGLADVRIKRAPLLGGIAYISGGPLVRRGTDEDVDSLGLCLDALRNHYVEKQGLILRIQGTMGEPIWNERSAEYFRTHGFSPASQGSAYRTVMVDLRPPLDAIRAALAQKWRNCLNKAERSNPPASVSTRIEDFDRFATLFAPFVGRKGFAVDLDADFYNQVQRQSTPAELLTLTTIEVDGALRAGHMSSLLGDTCVYLLGATSDEALKTNAAYLLQWNVIKMARERGMMWYDLGGIDPEANPGVYHFKCGMGGTEMVAPGPFEAAPHALRTRLLMGAESAYRRLRRHRVQKLSPKSSVATAAKEVSPPSPESSTPNSSR
jgi:hypothetical protein